MGSGWRRARTVLGLNACAGGPDEAQEDSPPLDEQPSTEADVSTSEVAVSVTSASAPPTPSRSPSRLNLNLIRTSIRLSRSTCAICLETMKPGLGHALFTAECTHTFHFSCIASNVRHGNLVCPVCRAKWKEVPWEAPADVSKELQRVAAAANSRTRRSHTTPIIRSSPQMSPMQSPLRGGGVEDSAMDPDDEEEQRRLDPVLRILDESIANARGSRRISAQEPNVFDDDEPLLPARAEAAAAANEGLDAEGKSSHQGMSQEGLKRPGDSERKLHSRRSVEIEVTCFPEVEAVAKSEERETFTVLVHLKSLAAKNIFRHREQSRSPPGREGDADLWGNCTAAQLLDPSCRAPLDLVTVLDISGSMAGTKLMLLKRAMGFVIRNLSPADRLSVVAFSSSAKRLFPLRLMVDEGRQLALRCVDSLASTGGTNIAEGLKKGAKVLEDRRMRNPVASIMLLSDGQDTYTMGNRGQFSGFSNSRVDYRRLLPGSIRHGVRYGHIQIPVHTFGFGADHDAATMHSISEVSGGTFSFIQAEGVVQDAFAQCIGGLLSVVVQDAQLNLSIGAPGVQIRSLQAGSYESSIRDNGSHGVVKLGDLYAEEERNVLVELKLPHVQSSLESRQEGTATTRVIRAGCAFRDPVTQVIRQTQVHELHILRPDFVDADLQAVGLEVDRQKNRVRIAHAILEAGTLADGGDMAGAQRVLQNAKDALRRTASSQAGDQLCSALEAEVVEIQARLANRQMYERSGRAYILSAQSSHFRQRATTRGDFSDSHSREYQTPSMVNMILRSQTPLPRGSASASSTPTRERRTHHSHSALSPSPTRGFLRDNRVRDSSPRPS